MARNPGIGNALWIEESLAAFGDEIKAFGDCDDNLENIGATIVFRAIFPGKRNRLMLDFSQRRSIAPDDRITARSFEVVVRTDATYPNPLVAVVASNRISAAVS